MNLKLIFKKRRHLIWLAIPGLIILAWLLIFLFSRPWQLAVAFRALNDLEASYERLSPCHEACLAKRLEYEARLVSALKSNLPGLKEKINEAIYAPKSKTAYKRELERLLTY